MRCQGLQKGRESMKKIWAGIIGTALSCMFLLSGCGGASKSMAADSAVTESAPAEKYATDDVYLEEAAAEDGGGAGSQLPEELQSNRKLIRTVSMQVETEEYDTLYTNINSRITALGGYVENSDIGKDGYGEYRRRYARITARIPKDKTDSFLESVAQESNVISKTENIEDVTLQYVDIESHKKALETEEKRLLELMERAENMEDIIAIESRLSEIRYQKESYISQIRTFDNQVDYTTIHLYIDEVQTLTPVEEPGAWVRIRTGFVRSAGNVIKGIRNFAIEFVIAIPYLLVLAVIVLVVLLIVRVIAKAGEKKHQRFLEERRMAAEKKASEKKQTNGGTDEPKL